MNRDSYKDIVNGTDDDYLLDAARKIFVDGHCAGLPERLMDKGRG